MSPKRALLAAVTTTAALTVVASGWAAGLVASSTDGRTLVNTKAPRPTAVPASLQLTIDSPAWSELARLTVSDGTVSAGSTVAVDGDTALVGAPYSDTNAGSQAGAVLVFTRSGGSWIYQATLTAADGGPSDWFGQSIALSGDVALVGTGVEAPCAVCAGAAYVFRRSAGAWTQEAKLMPSTDTRDFFGYSVALDGETALVAAPGADDDRGAAYIYTRTNGSWAEQAVLTAADATEGDVLGSAVALDGDTALLGARGVDSAAGFNAGAAYVFTRLGDTWAEEAKLVASDTSGNDTAGWAVDLDGNTALVGAYGADTAAGAFAGAAYVFGREGGIWEEEAKLVAPGASAFDQFGYAVAVDDGIALLSSPLTESLTGSVHAFVRADDSSWADAGELVPDVTMTLPA